MRRAKAEPGRQRDPKDKREIARLRSRLRRAEELIDAVRRGEVDAIVAKGPAGPRIFTLEGAEHAYRVMVEAMSEGALSLAPDGVILYCNRRFAELVKSELAEVIGVPLARFVAPDHAAAFEALMRRLDGGSARERIDLARSNGETVPAYVAMQAIDGGQPESIVTVVTELTAVQASEERYRRIVETLNDGVLMVDEALAITFVNPEFARMILRPEAELLGHSVADFMDDAGRDSFSARVERLRAELPDRSELGWRRADGSRLETLVSARPVFDRQRRYRGFAGIVTDLTDLKRAEMMRDQLGRIVEGAQDAIFGTDRDGRITSWNRGAAAICGYATDEVIGRSAEMIVPPEVRHAFADLMAAALGGAESTGHETGLLTKSGATANVVLNMSPIRDAERVVAGVSVIARDITEQRSTARALIKSQQKLDAARDVNERIVAMSFDLIITADGSGKVLHIGPRCEAIWGYKPEEIVGRDLGEFMYPDDAEGARRRARAIVAGEPPRETTTRFKRKDGTIEHMQWSGVWSEGEQTMFVVGRDLTEQLAAEERLKRSQRLEAIGKLTGGIAHDFNNLLTVIIGNSELLVQELKDNAARQRRARVSLEAAQRAANLTSQLLSFARRQTLAPKLIEVNKLVHDLLELIRRTLGAQIEIEFVPDPAVWRCKLDATQLESALLNLAVNARDAMPAGGRLTIATSNRMIADDAADEFAAGDYVAIEVADTGVGMPPEVAARAFEPFFTTKDIGQGSGLGLAMVYGFAKQSGGHVAIESEPGRGTKVTLYLPRAAQDAPVAEAPAESGSAPLPRGHETILVVEDDETVREFVADQLRSLGYRVLVAGNGPIARDILSGGEKVDLLFTDLMMPGGVSGVQLAEETERSIPGQRILLTSGYADSSMLVHAPKGIPYLRKPYKIRDLAAAVRQALGGGKRAA